MAMQLPKSQRKQRSSKVTPLRVVEHPNAFGAHLVHVRNRTSLPQQEVADALPEYFKECNVTFPTSNPRDMYRKTEKGIRAAQFEELIPLYATLIGCGIRHSAEERHTFVRLARLKLETLQRKRPKLRENSDWEWLEAQLAKIDQQEQERSAQTVLDAALSESVFDISHVVGRDDWLRTALAYLYTTPPKKLVVIQGMMGMGKTTCLKLLLHTLSEQDGYQTILHLFSDQQDMTSEDHFDNFLATILARREVLLPESKVPDRREQVKLLLNDLRSAGQRVVLLLDDAQVILDEHSQLPAVWQDFFTEFLQRPHQAMIYLATREWSMWPGRDPIYIVDGDKALLPRLSPEEGLEIWRRFGFGDVDAELLKRATERFGGNPRMIELRATTPQRRKLPFSWEWSETTQLTAPKSEHQEMIEQLLEDPQIFGDADVEVQQLLECVVSQHVSSDALPILEVLAVSPLALPFPLLVSMTPQAKYALVELLNTSLLDQTAIVDKRAGIQPLTREAVLHTFLKEGRRGVVERQISQLYQIWMDQGTFQDEQEQATLITEAVILYLKQNRFLEGAELFIRFGWLCALFGQVTRIQRAYEQVVDTHRGKDMGSAYEAGRILVLYNLQLIIGKTVDVRARDRDFHMVRELSLAGKVALHPHSEVYLAYTLMIRMIQEKRHPEAYRFLQDTMDRVAKTGGIIPEVRAAFLHNKAKLLGHWSSYALEMHQTDEAFRLRSDYVEVLAEVVQIWRSCLANSLPMQERYYHFKMARVLNDLAYCYRIINRLDEAEEAIKECLYLKEEKKATLPRSLAISLGEYAQILLVRGQYHQSDVQNAQAIERIDQILQSGDSSACADKGMLLVERANIYQKQGRIDEAKQLLKDALLLLDEDRAEFRFEAEQQLAHIQVVEESSPRYQLDMRWYQRYLPLASYSDQSWLAQAGPFTLDERHIWDQFYPRRNEPEIWRQLAEITKQSKEREFERSAREARLPQILYPAIDIDDIRSRIQGFTALQEAVEKEEENVVVHRLYMRKIEEHLITLRLVEATYKQDIDGLRRCNEALYGKISRDEMMIALRELFRMLMRAQSHPQAWEVAEPLLRQLKEWGLSVEDFLSPEEISEKRGVSPKLQEWRQTPVSSQAVQRFYQEAINRYGFTEWRIVPSPDRDTISLDLDLCTMYLPTNNRFTVLSVAEFLTEEVETHAFRAVAGKRSKVALLGSGTCGFLPTEEGLAALAIEGMMKAQALGPKLHSWVTTLSAGMATGVLTPPQSFASLCDFFGRAFLANHLQYGRYETANGATEAARYDTLVRISRTFRGIPDLTVTGVCNAKDRVYLQGYREVTDALAEYPQERLLVGSIGTDDLGDMEDLHILEPAVKHLHLAHDPQLFERITALEKES